MAGEKRLTLELSVEPEVARLLRIAAVERAAVRGGRPSVSGLVTDLAMEHLGQAGGSPPSPTAGDLAA